MSKPRIYTRSGDAGETSMLSGERVSKSDPHIVAVGDLDELSVALGFARLSYPNRQNVLKSIQQDLYKLSASVSYSGDKDFDQFKLPIDAVKKLEFLIDEISDALPPLKDFIYPGQSEASCRLHFARVVARRVERGLIALPAGKRDEAIKYVNRLSDLMFVLAREADQIAGAAEEAYSSK